MSQRIQQILIMSKEESRKAKEDLLAFGNFKVMILFILRCTHYFQ